MFKSKPVVPSFGVSHPLSGCVFPIKDDKKKVQPLLWGWSLQHFITLVLIVKKLKWEPSNEMINDQTGSD